MFDTICSLPLSSDLFTQAIHPNEPILSIGLAAGHVQTYRLPAIASEASEDGTQTSESGHGTIDTTWRTKRHKGSCRSLAFSADGEALYSAGTDGLVKAASTATGQVSSKIAIRLHNSTIDPPSLLHALSPQTLLLATDSAALHLYDLRANSSFQASTPQQTYHPHDDYVSSLTPLSPFDTSKSGFSKQWISTGGTTLAVTDLRRGVLVKSEDQEEELLSSVFVGGLPVKAGRSKGEKILVGGGSGVLTLWERGVWDDQDERIIVDRGVSSGGGGESLDALAVVPEGVGEGKLVAVGMGDGKIRVVRMGINKVVAEIRHDEVEGVLGLGFEIGGRMVSGGGQVVKVWQEKVQDEDGEDEVDEVGAKRIKESDSEDESNEDRENGSSEEEEEEEETARKKRKRRKRNRGKDSNVNKHVMAFKGMD